MTNLPNPDGYKRIKGFKQYGEPLPGSGPVSLIWVDNREVYASQVEADGTLRTYRASPLGWVLQVYDA